MTVDDVIALLRQRETASGDVPDALWMGRADADELVQDATGDRLAKFDETRRATIWGVPVCLLEVL